MGAVGFEPTKAEPSDLQSDPFVHFGTRPDRFWSPHAAQRASTAQRASHVSHACSLWQRGAESMPAGGRVFNRRGLYGWGGWMCGARNTFARKSRVGEEFFRGF